MASLKQEYGEVFDFYFIHFNDERAEYIAKDFKIERHPETIFLDKDNNMLTKVQGYNGGMEKNLRNLVKEISDKY